MSIRKTSAQRLAAAVGALALIVSGTFIGPASAAPGEPGTPPGNTDEGTTGSLTIHKRIGVQDGTHNGANLGSSAPGVPLPGVTFSAQRVGIWNGTTCTDLDLSTSEGWDAAEAAVGANPAAPSSTPANGDLCAAGDALEETTADPSGAATFANLALGLYYIVETDAPDNVVDEIVPFYVTIPFPSETGDVVTWLYDVHAYPKNAVAEAPVKAITERPNSVVIGSNVTWTITQEIPTLTSTGASFASAVIEDTLDPRLEYVSSVLNIVPAPTAPDTDLVAGDYAFVEDAAMGKLTWTLNAGGLAKLKANQSSDLVATVVTAVTSVTDGDLTAGVIANDAKVTINGKPGVTPPVYTYWGNLVVNKLDGATPLAGAQFDVFEKGTADCAATHPGGTALASGTSGSDGVVKWGTEETGVQGLWIANSNTELNDPDKEYCLYETKAPAGYVRVVTPTVVTITTADLATFTQDIQNTKVPGPNLPLTGSSGTLMLTIAGIGLVGLGVGGVALRRRSTKQN